MLKELFALASRSGTIQMMQKVTRWKTAFAGAHANVRTACDWRIIRNAHSRILITPMLVLCLCHACFPKGGDNPRL